MSRAAFRAHECRHTLSCRRSAPQRSQIPMPRFRQYIAAVEKLDRFAQVNYSKRVIHLALRWLLDRPGVGVALWGARRPDQLAPVTDVMGWRIDDGAMAEIDRILENINRRSGRPRVHGAARAYRRLNGGYPGCDESSAGYDNDQGHRSCRQGPFRNLGAIAGTVAAGGKGAGTTSGLLLGLGLRPGWNSTPTMASIWCSRTSFDPTLAFLL